MFNWKQKKLSKTIFRNCLHRKIKQKQLESELKFKENMTWRLEWNLIGKSFKLNLLSRWKNIINDEVLTVSVDLIINYKFMNKLAFKLPLRRKHFALFWISISRQNLFPENSHFVILERVRKSRYQTWFIERISQSPFLNIRPRSTHKHYRHKQ